MTFNVVPKLWVIHGKGKTHLRGELKGFPEVDGELSSMGMRKRVAH